MMARKRRGRKRVGALQFVLLTINVLLVAGTLLAYASNFISPGNWRILALAGLSFPFLLVAHIMMMVIWILCKPRWLLLSLFTLLAGLNIVGRYVQLNYPDEFDHSDSIVSVASFNARYYNIWGLYGKPRYGSLDSTLQFFREHHPDILCVQEAFLSHERTGNIGDKVRKELGYSSIHSSPFLPGISNGIAIFFNAKALQKGVVEKDGRTIALWVDLDIKGRIFRVYGVHLQSTGLGQEAYVMEKLSPGAYKDSLFMEGSRQVARKLLRASVIRAGQADLLKDHIAASPYPVVVCSDLNDPPCSYSYTRISGGLRDAFVKAGRGTGRTYHGKFPSFRIDYIFVSRSMNIHQYTTYRADFSDHNPVFAWLSLPPVHKAPE